MQETVRYARAGETGTVTLDRPGVLNAMNGALVADLRRALTTAADDPALRALVLRGAGRAFCAGADLAEPDVDAAAWRRRLDDEQAIARLLKAMHVPVVAALHGAAIGGGLVLALLADLRIAAAGTRLALPELRVGAAVSFGGLYQLPRVVGLGRAFELLYLADTVDAAEGERLGLVTRVVPAADLDGAISAMTARLASLVPGDVAATRRVLSRSLDLDFDAALAAEGAANLHSFASGARRDAMTRARAALEARRTRG